jgi:hypothetical protein
MRREGGDQLAKAYADALRALGLEEAPSITPSRLGEQGDEYLIPYPGGKRELDRHLKKGNSRESKHCFRLYFFWDDEEEQVVVGWLTSHLDTRQTGCARMWWRPFRPREARTISLNSCGCSLRASARSILSRISVTVRGSSPTHAFRVENTLHHVKR